MHRSPNTFVHREVEVAGGTPSARQRVATDVLGKAALADDNDPATLQVDWPKGFQVEATSPGRHIRQPPASIRRPAGVSGSAVDQA